MHELPHAVTEVSGTQLPLHLLKVALHVKSHWPAVQAAAPLAIPGQGVHDVPHVAGDASDTHCMPQRWKPVLQVKSQACIEVQTGVAFAGAVHAMQRVPHEPTASSGWQVAPQRWKPLLHSKSHAALMHAGREFSGKEHGPQRVPHEFAAVSSAQTVPHAWKPVLHATPHTPALQVGVPVGAVHGVHREPQLATSSFDAQVSPHLWKFEGQVPASGRTRSQRLSAQVSVGSHSRQKSPPVPQAALSLPG